MVTATRIRPNLLRIMDALSRYHFLTAEQICRLLYTFPSSLHHAYDNTRALAALGMIQNDLFLSRTSAIGRSPSVYTLTAKGQRELGIDARKSRVIQPLHTIKLEHTLAINDVLIALELLTRTSDRFVLRSVQHDLDLQKDPFYVTVEGKKTYFVPDAWAELVTDGAYQECFSFEIDMGTESRPKWVQKVKAILPWSGAPYQKAFGTDVLTVAVVCFGKNAVHRATTLCSWTETALKQAGRENMADMFRFTCLNPAEMPPEIFFTQDSWFKPFDKDTYPLLGGAE